MNIKEEVKPGQQAETRLADDEVAAGNDAYAPRKVTFTENVILSIKLLVGFGMLGAALWGIDVWIAAR